MTEQLVIERILDADCQTVFEAWTDPEVIRQWFFVGPSWSAEVENDLRVGGGYRLKMITDEGEVMEQHGEYREIDPPNRLVFSWSSHAAEDTLVTIDLEPMGDRTRLRLTHELLPTEETRQAHAGGWAGCLGNLEHLLAG